MATKDWKKTKDNFYDTWQNKNGDWIQITWVQDRDGKNAFVHTAYLHSNNNAMGIGRKTKLFSGRNEVKIRKKVKSYMRTH